MPVYFEYALKASLCLAIVFIFYTLLLKQTTYFTCNRYFLLSFSILSFIFPFINITVFVHAHQPHFISFVNHVPIIANNKITTGFGNSFKTVNYGPILFTVYLFISSILSFRFVVQLLSIRRIRAKATRTVAGGVEIFNLSEPVLPFSFLNSIFINKDNYSQEELQEIIAHEQVHVQQNHTIDVLITELICIFNWFNPFAWLIKKAIRENLEFIADDVVIQKGVDRKNYQYLLLKVTGCVSSSIASNLKFTLLKNRIRMMNKSKTRKLHLLKFALLVPLVTFLLLAFRNKHEVYKATFKEQNAETKKYILSSLTYSVPDEKVEAVVKKDKKNCLLKTGEALNLDMVFNEKTRLKKLLEKSGYNNISDHAVTFMIDTTSGSNGFSIQVNINLAKDELSKSQEEPSQNSNQIDTHIHPQEKLIQSANSVIKLSTNVSNEDEFNNKQLILDNKFSSIK